MKEPIFEYEQETGTAICALTYKDTIILGSAQCHSDDMDLSGEKTGCTIALLRAEIKYFQHIKNNELWPKLQALSDLYYQINISPKFNEESYFARRL